MKTTTLSIPLVVGLALQACGGSIQPAVSWELPGFDGGIPATPYVDLLDAGARHMDGPVLPLEDTGSWTDGPLVGDSGTATDGAVATPDAGSFKVCSNDEFNTARTAGDLPLTGKIDGKILGDCDAVLHPLILARDQGVNVELWGQGLFPDLRIYGPGVRGMQIQNRKLHSGVLATADFTADLPGEYYVYIAQAGRRGMATYTVTSNCLAQCSLRTTRYPTILAHGFSGFKDILSFEYFYKVVDTVAPDGYDLHVSVIDPYNSIQKRGPQLADVIDGVLDKTYARKVNIIGHSQGGLDSRYAISELGYADKVGMLNTVATPHRGTPIADIALKDPVVMGLFKAFFGAVGIIIEGPEMEHALEASLDSMSTVNMIKFNESYPPDPRVRYRSWTGRTCGLLDGCKKPVDLELLAIYKIVYEKAGDNDGLVPVTSGIWEGYQGLIEADHIDEVGHLIGMTGSFDHLAFYRHVIESMADEGF